MYVRIKHGLRIFGKIKVIGFDARAKQLHNSAYTNFQRAHNCFQTAKGCKEDLYRHDLVTA